jgi:hypothetical protein
MTLRYSYGPQVNPRTSAVEVLLDDVFIGGARLASEEWSESTNPQGGSTRQPDQATSKIQVAFRLNPREPGQCGR